MISYRGKIEMRKKRIIRIWAWLLAISIMMSLTGCGKNLASHPEADNISVSNQEIDTTPENTNNNLLEEQSTPDPETTESTTPKVDSEKDDDGLTEQHRNSFSMLYYLAITAEDIRISKNNRLILDDIYTSLLNDINPGAIDETTQDHLKNLRDIIKSFINISVKRDRLQYIYNQKKAATIKSAVPNPLAILAMTNSFDWKKLVTSVSYTVVDSYTSYKSANATIDQEFMMSGWDLDDEETAAIQKNKDRAFDYMVDIVQEYGLDGMLTLNEESIRNFADICKIETVQQKIRRLESEEETYKLLGNYWLELADCYYQTSQYEKCLDCVDKYNALATGIYRKDYNYARILPKAIVSAQESYKGEEYVSHVGAFTDDIMKNTTTENWSTRYFAAQVYLDLYARTSNREYLKKAYNIAYDNVTILLDEQQKLNKTYLEDVQKVNIPEPDYRFMSEKEKKEAKKEYKNEKKRLKAYNESLEDARKTELPPLYEPFVLNCDLLFALSDEVGISKKEKGEIEDILHTDENGVFLSKPINNRYSFTSKKTDYNIKISKDEIIIPVNLLTAGAKISVTVSDDGKTKKFDDCVVSEVVRKDRKFDTFEATITSKKMKDYKWSKKSKVAVEISNGDSENPLTFNFKVTEFKNNWFIADKVVFAEE